MLNRHVGESGMDVGSSKSHASLEIFWIRSDLSSKLPKSNVAVTGIQSVSDMTFKGQVNGSVSGRLGGGLRSYRTDGV